jgi:LysR family transcriptional regulator (chromosome initiation inhibitor)
VASPVFIAQAMPQGLSPQNFHQLPFIVFNRKDDMQAQWVAKAFGVREPRLRQRHVPSSEAGARAAEMGWGVAVLPELLARPLIESGALVQLRPDSSIDVALFWHHWKLSGEPERAGPAHSGLIDRIGLALIEGARVTLGRSATD